MLTTDALKLAWQLMEEHGLIGAGWTFDFDRAVVRFGATHYKQRQITLSRKLTELNDEAQVRDTILHEIAHALCGAGAGHSYKWRAKARGIGCNGRRTYSSRTVAAPPRELTGTCPNCPRVIKAHRRRKVACRVCCQRYNYGRFDIKYAIIWS